MCTFGDDNQMIAGDGLIWLEAGSDPSKPLQRPIQFKVMSTELRDHVNSIEGVETGMVAEAIAAQGVCAPEQSFAFEVTNDIHEDVMAIPDEKAKKGEEHITEDLMEGVTKVIESTEAFEKRQRVVEQIDGPTPAPPAYIRVQAVETYDMICFPDALTETPSGREPARVFQVVKVRKDPQTGASSFDFIVPALDLLAEKLTAALPDLPNKSTTPLYSTEVHRNEKQEFVVSLKIDQPERLALAADDNIHPESYGEKSKSYRNLKFSNHGVDDLVLPFLFGKVVFTTNTLLGILGGQMIEFDPTAVGDDGNWHMVNGKKTVPPTPPTIPPSAGPVLPPDGQTSGPARFLSQQPGGKSVEDLIYGLNINTTELKQDTQKVLFRTMLYHMNDEDRDKILKVGKPIVSDSPIFSPETLPSELGEALDPNLRKWIKDKYAMAWIAQNIASMPTEQKKVFNITVDNRSQRRLDYFWRGGGKGCLSQSTEYNNLNTQIAVSCLRRKYLKVLDYIRDKAEITNESIDTKLRGMTGGKKWAHLLFESLMTVPMVEQIARESALSEITVSRSS